MIYGGFSFAGVDIATLGLVYAPENSNTYIYSPSNFDVSEKSFAAHDGGYYYGATVKPKDFTLRCIFEASPINDGMQTRINHLFARGKTGRLVFDTRPWCYYVATVIKPPQLQITNYANGIITFYLRAYYPFARSDQTRILENDPNEQDLINNSGMLKDVGWDTNKDFCAEGSITEQTPIYVYNPGTELAATQIEISGNVGAGITIYNDATKQTCKIVAFNSENDTLILDSLSGKVMVRSQNGQMSYGFLYHDNGFIDLASSYPAQRNITIKKRIPSINPTYKRAFTVTDNSYTLTQDDVGRSIGFDLHNASAVLGGGVIGSMVLNNSDTSGEFFIARISKVEDNGKDFEIDLDCILPNSIASALPTFNSSIIPCNKLIITPSSSMNITKFVVRYKPTFT